MPRERCRLGTQSVVKHSLWRTGLPPGQEGWTRHQEKYREASFDGADGVVDQDQTEMFLNLNHHPVCAASDLFFCQSPLLARRGYGPVRQVCSLPPSATPYPVLAYAQTSFAIWTHALDLLRNAVSECSHLCEVRCDFFRIVVVILRNRHSMVYECSRATHPVCQRRLIP